MSRQGSICYGFTSRCLICLVWACDGGVVIGCHPGDTNLSPERSGAIYTYTNFALFLNLCVFSIYFMASIPACLKRDALTKLQPNFWNLFSGSLGHESHPMCRRHKIGLLLMFITLKACLVFQQKLHN